MNNTKFIVVLVAAAGNYIIYLAQNPFAVFRMYKIDEAIQRYRFVIGFKPQQLPNHFRPDRGISTQIPLPRPDTCSLLCETQSTFALAQCCFAAHQFSLRMRLLNFPRQLIEITWTIDRVAGRSERKALACQLFFALPANQNHRQVFLM